MKTSEKIYRRIKKEMAFDDNAMALVGMSQAKIETGYQQLINAGHTDAKAEATIMQLWEKAKKGLNIKSSVDDAVNPNN